MDTDFFLFLERSFPCYSVAIRAKKNRYEDWNICRKFQSLYGGS